MRISFIAFIVVLAVAGREPLVAAERPNILFILCDDLGYGDLGVTFQNQRAAKKDPAVPHFSTPKIDTLARDGMTLEQHYCGAPVCAPSRASLLTGLTQGHANVRNNQFDKALADTHTIGSVLQRAGYATSAIGKWGLQGAPKKNGSPAEWPAYPTKRGFDDFYGYVRHKDGHFHYPKEDQREIWDNDREVASDLDLCFTTDLFTARAKKWISEHSRSTPDKPFFLFLAYDTPHAVLHNPPCEFPAGGGLTGGLQWTGKPHAMINTATGKMDSWMHPDYAGATWDNDGDGATLEKPWPTAQKRYANNVRRIDDCVGDLLQLLTDLEIADDTVVIFTSDNGPSTESYLPGAPYQPDFFHGFGPFDGIKRDTLEGGLRVPMLVRWPAGIAAGSVDKKPSGQWDWLATFAEMAGVPAPAASDGVSLVPNLTGKGERAAGTLYVEYFQEGKTPGYPTFSPNNRQRKRGQMQVVFADGYKGLRYNVQSADDPFEIYDLKNDPQETRNLAKTESFSRLQTTMKALALQSRMPDPSAPRPYDDALVPALTAEPAGSEGLTCSVFPGDWPWIPDFRTLTAEKKSGVPSPALPTEIPDGPFGIFFEGSFYAAEDGEYQFTAQSEGGASIFLHDCRVIAGSKDASAETSSGKIWLQAGWHPIRISYRHASGKPALEISVIGPNGISGPIPSHLFRQTGGQ